MIDANDFACDKSDDDSDDDDDDRQAEEGEALNVSHP